MVGCQRKHDRVGIAPARKHSPGGDCGGRVASHRIEDDGCVDPQLLGLRARRTESHSLS